MQYTISHPLTEAQALKTPLVKPDVTWDQYLDILRAEAIKHHRQFELAVDQLTKWIQEDSDLSLPAAISEEYLEELRGKAKRGEKVGLKGNQLNKSTIRKIFTDIRLLHNRVQVSGQKSKIILRSFIDGRLISRFMFFNTLTEQTQQAIIIFEQSGTKPPYDKQIMTGQTRKGAIESALFIIRRLGINNLELISPEHIASLTANPDANNPEYRQISRYLHDAACLFRFCVRKGLLPNNPLTHIDNSLFANHAIRDFLPPDQLEILLDIHGSKNVTHVDLNDELSVRDWLVALLLVDLALRRSELAGLSWDNIQHNREDDGYQIRLAPENQKMTTKTVTVLPILYPATQELLEHYARMRGIKIGQNSNTPLILDKRGQPASSGTIARIVHQLAIKIGLRTYHQAVPSCHDLRRTFATCNAKPLGLGLDLQELAERLRAGINVVYQYYIVQNPLLQEAKAKIYRDKLKPKGVDEETLELLSKIESFSPGNKNLLEKFRDTVMHRINAKQEAKELSHTPSWINEAEALAIFNQFWSQKPTIRPLREYFSSRKALTRAGKHGMVYYDAVIVRKLVDKYEPVSDHIEKLSRAISGILAGFDSISIGCVKLIKREQMGTFLRSIGNRSRKLARSNTRKTYPTLLAKQEPAQTAQKLGYAEIA